MKTETPVTPEWLDSKGFQTLDHKTRHGGYAGVILWEKGIALPNTFLQLIVLRYWRDSGTVVGLERLNPKDGQGRIVCSLAEDDDDRTTHLPKLSQERIAGLLKFFKLETSHVNG